MNFFIVLNGKHIKQFLLIIIAAFFTAWFLYLQNYLHIPTFVENKDLKAVFKGEKNVALTFNIGWGDEKAEPILNVLKKEKVLNATFFLSGSWAERHPELVERIKKDGHEIGILGYNYKNYAELEESEIQNDILKAVEAFKKLNIKDIQFVRAPTGQFDEKLLKVAQRLGLTVVHWSIDSKDWQNPGIETIKENVTKAKKGDIILLHASDSAKQTAKALPGIINHFQNKNLKLVSVSEMIANSEAKTREIK